MTEQRSIYSTILVDTVQDHNNRYFYAFYWADPFEPEMYVAAIPMYDKAFSPLQDDLVQLLARFIELHAHSFTNAICGRCFSKLRYYIHDGQYLCEDCYQELGEQQDQRKVEQQA